MKPSFADAYLNQGNVYKVSFHVIVISISGKKWERSCLWRKIILPLGFSRPWECFRRLSCAIDMLFRHVQTMPWLMVSIHWYSGWNLYHWSHFISVVLFLFLLFVHSCGWSLTIWGNFSFVLVWLTVYLFHFITIKGSNSVFSEYMTSRNYLYIIIQKRIAPSMQEILLVHSMSKVS